MRFAMVPLLVHTQRRAARSCSIALIGALLCVLGALLPSKAHAQSCSASVSPISFGTVTPITNAAVNASGTITVSCTWPTNTLTPAALVCLNLTATQPRAMTMTGGAATMGFDLYRDSAMSQSWGSTTNGTTPISVSLVKPSGGTTASTTVSYYGQIAANQPTVPTTNNADTIYTRNFTAADTTLSYGFALVNLLGQLACGLVSAQGSFPFQATATVTNNCTITASNLAFPAAGVLNKPIVTTGTISAQCTSGDAFRISLSAGSSGSVAARKMKLVGGSATVGYQIYTDQARTLAWGDATAGTTTVTGIGTGNTAQFTMYGLVPAQSTPQPGNYSDTITATISF